MNNKKVLKELSESVSEALESIEAIKGKSFANLVRYIQLSMHTFRFTTMIADEEYRHALPVLAAQYTSMLDIAMIEMTKGMSKEDQHEAFEWAENIDKRVGNATQEINK